MDLEVSVEQLKQLVARQLGNLFYFDEDVESTALFSAIDEALERCKYCFATMKKRSKYYTKGEELYFNPYHSGQYTIFLYYLSNSIYKNSPSLTGLSDRVYYLNKALNGLDLFYEVQMPRAFFLDHPMGTVLGRANYGEKFSFSQACTVGNNKGKYPTIGKNVKMLSGSKIIGDSSIGDNVLVAANTYIKDAIIPSCSIVFGNSPDLIIKQKDSSYFD